MGLYIHALLQQKGLNTLSEYAVCKSQIKNMPIGRSILWNPHSLGISLPFHLPKSGQIIFQTLLSDSRNLLQTRQLRRKKGRTQLAHGCAASWADPGVPVALPLEKGVPIGAVNPITAAPFVILFRSTQKKPSFATGNIFRIVKTYTSKISHSPKGNAMIKSPDSLCSVLDHFQTCLLCHC